MRKVAELILAFVRKLVQPFMPKRAEGRGPAVTMDTDLFMAGISGFIGEGKDVEMTPKGFSMLPFIRGGVDSVVLTKPSRPLEVGDIVLAKVGERYIMHRVFKVDGDALTLMGDGNLKGTESCASGDVIGLVKTINKAGGKVVEPGKGRLWRFLLPVRRYLLAIYKRVFL